MELTPPQEVRVLRGVVAALLFRLYPEAELRGADITILPDEIMRADGWMLCVYTGVGIGVRPPMRVVLQRPSQTVAGAVVEEAGEGKPGIAGQPPRALPPGR